MKTIILLSCAALIAAPTAGFAKDETPASTQVEVIFHEPEKFTDFKHSELGHEKDREDLMMLFREHLQDVVPAHLAEGQKLTITFTDVDLAGDFELWHSARFSDVRIVKGIYPPRAVLKFKLTDATGTVVKEGERTLRDLNFQMSMSLYFNNDSIRYEKGMLDDWLRQEFGQPRKQKRK